MDSNHLPTIQLRMELDMLQVLTIDRGLGKRLIPQDNLLGTTLRSAYHTSAEA